MQGRIRKEEGNISDVALEISEREIKGSNISRKFKKDAGYKIQDNLRMEEEGMGRNQSNSKGEIIGKCNKSKH